MQIFLCIFQQINPSGNTTHKQFEDLKSWICFWLRVFSSTEARECLNGCFLIGRCSARFWAFIGRQLAAGKGGVVATVMMSLSSLRDDWDYSSTVSRMPHDNFRHLETFQSSHFLKGPPASISLLLQIVFGGKFKCVHHLLNGLRKSRHQGTNQGTKVQIEVPTY